MYSLKKAILPAAIIFFLLFLFTLPIQAHADVIAGPDEGQSDATQLGEAFVQQRYPDYDGNVLMGYWYYDPNSSKGVCGDHVQWTIDKNGHAEVMDDAKAAGINDSIIHVDFMVGADDLSIDGITADGRSIPIFRSGTWADETRY